MDRGEKIVMIDQSKRPDGGVAIKFIVKTIFYFAILLTLYFLYGFHSANTGSYIYNDF